MYVSISMKALLPRLSYCTLMILAVTVAFAAACNVKTDDGVSSSGDDSRPVLIIDAGHGGDDGGAQAADGTLEADINLAVAQKLDALAGLWGQPRVMTRESSEIDYPDSARSARARKVFDQKARLEFINSIENGILISIHQNKFPTEQPRGSQVLYAGTQGSEELGCVTHENLIKALYPENRRVPTPVPNSIYITKYAKCPAILIECGFLSNREEAGLLVDSAYQKKIAAVILASYLQHLNGDTYEI